MDDQKIFLASVLYDVESVGIYLLDVLQHMREIAPEYGGDTANDSPKPEEAARERSEKERMLGGFVERIEDVMSKSRGSIRRVLRDNLDVALRNAVEQAITSMLDLVLDLHRSEIPPEIRTRIRKHSLDLLGDMPRPRRRRPPRTPWPRKDCANFIAAVDRGQRFFERRRELERDRGDELFDELPQLLSEYLPHEREQEIARDLLRRVRTGWLQGSDKQPKALALQFAAEILALPTATARTLRTRLRDCRRAIEQASGK